MKKIFLYVQATEFTMTHSQVATILTVNLICVMTSTLQITRHSLSHKSTYLSLLHVQVWPVMYPNPRQEAFTCYPLRESKTPS